jgi:transcriptional regulator with XRE-family HTH domain
MNFALLRAIKENGLTQKDFSTIVGDDPSIVSRIVNGIWNPDDMRKIRYAKALKKRVKDLF